MFGWFRRRFVPSPPPEPIVSAVPRAPSPASAFMPPPPPEPESDAQRERAREALRDQLRARLAERVHALTAELGRGAQADDVRALLHRLAHAEDRTLRPIPTAAQRALRLARHPLANLQDVAEAFERDPSLAEGLLRMANSAWYRIGTSEVDSLHDALQRTGSAGAETVIMKHSLQGTLCRPGGACEAMTAQVWLHLTRTAAIARGLGRGFGIDPETAYLLGLMHDTGKLVLFDALSEHRRRTRTTAPLPFPLLRRMLHELHEPLGGLALLRWGLDPALAEAVADHHRQGEVRTVNAAAELLFVAERTDLALATGASCDPERWIHEGGLALEARTLRGLCGHATDGALRFTEQEWLLPAV